MRATTIGADLLLFLFIHSFIYLFIYLFNLLSFVFFRAVPTAYGDSQARDLFRATAAGLHHSHSNTGSESHLQPTPQLAAMPDP